MSNFKPCRKCKGEGGYPVTRQVPGGGLIGWRQACDRCEGTGKVPYDPWALPTAIFVAFIAAYFAWQLFIR